MKKIFLLTSIILCFFLNSAAESTLYFFVTSLASSDAQLYIDGKEIAPMNGSIKKTMDGNGMFKIDYVVRQKCFRKLIFQNEGKVVVSVKLVFTDCMNLKKTTHMAEFPIDLENGETYYLEFKGKGFNDCQIKKVEQKKADKWLSKELHKWDNLGDISITESSKAQE